MEHEREADEAHIGVQFYNGKLLTTRKPGQLSQSRECDRTMTRELISQTRNKETGHSTHNSISSHSHKSLQRNYTLIAIHCVPHAMVQRSITNHTRQLISQGCTAQIFQKSKSHFKILGARRGTRSKLLTQDPLMGANVKQFSRHSEMAPPCPSGSTYICERYSSNSEQCEEPTQKLTPR
jgi:hypothetical protein